MIITWERNCQSFNSLQAEERLMVVNEKPMIKTIYCWMEKLFLLFLALYLLKNAQYMTILNLSPFEPAWADRFLLISLSITAGLKLFLLFESDAQYRKKWLNLVACAILISLIWFLVYLRDRSTFLLYLSVLVLGSIGTDYRTLLKIQVCVVGTVVLSAALCCMCGVIENRIYWGHGTIRSSFGFTYPTNMAAYYLFLVIAAWTALDETWDPVFLLPGVISILISDVIADSRTSFLCSGMFLFAVLWCWLLRSKGENGIVLRIHKYVKFLCGIMFPLCALLAITLTVAYHNRLPFMSELNEWTSNRLAQQSDAFYQYGIHLFGFSFPMRGLASGFPVLDVNYVDCSYLQLLLQYGILIFAAYLFLWPFMTVSAIKAGKHRLVLGLALIALHSLLEQRFLVVSYNLFLIAPFSVLSLRFHAESEKQYEHRDNQKLRVARYAAFITAVIMALPVVLFWKPLLSGARTLWSVIQSPDLTIQLYQRGLCFLTSAAFLAGCVLVFFLVNRITLALLSREKLKIRYVVMLVLCISAGSLFLVKGNVRLDRAMREYTPYLEEDSAVVSLAKEIDDLQLYEADLPTLYNRMFGGISTGFFNGEDLARLHNLAVITDLDHQWATMFLSGFSYAEISDNHAVYTDSSLLAEGLERAGYQPGPYYSKEMTVNMRKLAEWNQLTIDSDESVVISSDQPILNVPDLDLKSGYYTFYFDLSLLPSSPALTKLKDDETVFVLRFSDNSGTRSLFEQTVTFGQFEDNGYLNYEVTSNFDAAGVEFALIPEPGVQIALRTVTYRITQ